MKTTKKGMIFLSCILPLLLLIHTSSFSQTVPGYFFQGFDIVGNLNNYVHADSLELIQGTNYTEFRFSFKNQTEQPKVLYIDMLLITYDLQRYPLRYEITLNANSSQIFYQSDYQQKYPDLQGKVGKQLFITLQNEPFAPGTRYYNYDSTSIHQSGNGHYGGMYDNESETSQRIEVEEEEARKPSRDELLESSISDFGGFYSWQNQTTQRGYEEVFSMRMRMCGGILDNFTRQRHSEQRELRSTGSYEQRAYTRLAKTQRELQTLLGDDYATWLQDEGLAAEDLFPNQRHFAPYHVQEIPEHRLPQVSYNDLAYDMAKSQEEERRRLEAISRRELEEQELRAQRRAASTETQEEAGDLSHTMDDEPEARESSMYGKPRFRDELQAVETPIQPANTTPNTNNPPTTPSESELERNTTSSTNTTNNTNSTNNSSRTNNTNTTNSTNNNTNN